MAYPSEIERWQFNEIEACKTYSFEVGKLLRDKLGKLLVEASNYYPTGSAVTEGDTYSVTFNIISTEDNTLVDTVTPLYVAGIGDGVTEVIEGLAEWIVTETTDTLVDPASDYMIANVYTDYPSDTDKHMFFVAKQGYILEETAKLNMESDSTKAWTPSDAPAVYLGYGTAPKAEYPRIVVTPIVHTTVCDRMEESVMLVDTVETEYTSSYIDYSINLTAEGGDTDTVLRTGKSGQSVLNDLKKRMVNEQIKKRLQNAMNSVYHPIESILPLPLMAQTQYTDIARCTSKWSCVDIFYPDDLSGYMEAVQIEGSTDAEPENPDGIKYLYDKDGEVVIYGQEMNIDRRTV